LEKKYKKYMKAILVINEMPNSCDECEVRCGGYTAKEYSEKSIKRPSWCPLKPFPRMSGVVHQDADGWCKLSDYSRGWNDCLEEIEK
jgi:aldehyde:ferredoxin oxidoreductase